MLLLLVSNRAFPVNELYYDAFYIHPVVFGVRFSCDDKLIETRDKAKDKNDDVLFYCSSFSGNASAQELFSLTGGYIWNAVYDHRFTEEDLAVVDFTYSKSTGLNQLIAKFSANDSNEIDLPVARAEFGVGRYAQMYEVSADDVSRSLLFFRPTIAYEYYRDASDTYELGLFQLFRLPSELGGEKLVKALSTIFGEMYLRRRWNDDLGHQTSVQISNLVYSGVYNDSHDLSVVLKWGMDHRHANTRASPITLNFEYSVPISDRNSANFYLSPAVDVSKEYEDDGDWNVEVGFFIEWLKI